MRSGLTMTSETEWPVFTVIGAGFLFGESFTVLQWAGVLLLSASILGLAVYNLGHVVIERSSAESLRFAKHSLDEVSGGSVPMVCQRFLEPGFVERLAVVSVGFHQAISVKKQEIVGL